MKRASQWLCLCLVLAIPATAADRAKRVLIIGHQPDTHAWGTHEYMSAAALMHTMLSRVDGVQPVVVQADGKWQGGPDLLDSADGVFLFGNEGGKWISDDAMRLEAFRRLAKRSGGLACWHWGMGTKEAEPIDAFVELFGGCHGGPDRKHKVMQVRASVATPTHPITMGIKPFDVKEEFYYALKFGKNPKRVTPLITIRQDEATHAVGWAWERSGGGRSFGFSGGHFHGHWRMEEYRRLAVQGVLWSLKVPFDEKLDVSVDRKLLALKRPKPAKK